MAANTGDRREQTWLWQRLSLAVIRGNATSVLTTTDGEDHSSVIEHASRAGNYSEQQEQGRGQCETEEPPLPSSAPLLALLDVDLDGSMSQPHRDRRRESVDPLEEFRVMCREMQAEVATSNDRDPRADPDLARYLGPPT